MTDTSQPTAPAPIRSISESEAEQYELSSYVLFVRAHACVHCNAVQNYCDLHEVWTHPFKTALTKAKILKSAKQILPGFEISTVHIPIISVPVCHECITSYTPAANRIFPAASYSAWSDTLQRKAVEAVEARKEAARMKTTPTLDQL